MPSTAGAVAAADTVDRISSLREFPTGKNGFRTIHDRVVLYKQPTNQLLMISAADTCVLLV